MIISRRKNRLCNVHGSINYARYARKIGGIQADRNIYVGY